MIKEDELFVIKPMDVHVFNYIQSVLSSIREQANDYGMRLLTMDLGTAQGIRDNLSTFTAQLADIYGDIVTEHDLSKYDYNLRLKERKIELWKLYQSKDTELNPGGKLSSSQAETKARYQAEIDCYPMQRKIARLKGLEEQANALWRYTIPKLLDSIASRIALTKEYPNGLPTTAMPMSVRQKSAFNEVFGDLDEQVNKATTEIKGISEEHTISEEDIPDNSAYNNPDL